MGVITACAKHYTAPPPSPPFHLQNHKHTHTHHPAQARGFLPCDKHLFLLGSDLECKFPAEVVLGVVGADRDDLGEADGDTL